MKEIAKRLYGVTTKKQRDAHSSLCEEHTHDSLYQIAIPLFPPSACNRLARLTLKPLLLCGKSRKSFAVRTDLCNAGKMVLVYLRRKITHMKVLLFMLLCVPASVSAQSADTLLQLPRQGRAGLFVENLFWSDAQGGFYIGTIGSYEMNHYALGGEAKLYASFYHALLSNSIYANARHLYTSQPGLPNTAIGVGVHLLIFGLEGNAYLGGDKDRWYLTPKIGMDWGNASLFYGYGFPLGTNDLSPVYRHSLSVKYSFYLGTFGL